MAGHPLDNPIWAALHTRHRALARQCGDCVRYPPAVAPFLAVASAGAGDAAALAELVPPGDTAYGLGPAPHAPPGWHPGAPVTLAQMVFPEPQPELPGADIVELTRPAQQADVLALAALVYPRYFRPRTPTLGRYFGIYEDGRLAAMVGERMATPEWREVSAVCAHPQASGRGHARRLLLWLSNRLLASGERPFLHVSPENQRAFSLYQRNGYHVRRELAHWSLARDPAAASAPAATAHPP